MGYKVANLVKAIKPSDATEAETDKNARRFIQQVQGKSFNDFVNIAKKGNYQFSNPKQAKRFEGQLQGLGTEKDGDILAWALIRKEKKEILNFYSRRNRR
jgi:peptidyl-prolyl cis-trans isomerase D